MKDKIVNLLKNRGVLSAIVALVAAVGGYSVDKVDFSLPVFKVEVTNWPADASNTDVPPSDPTPPKYDFPYELVPPKVEEGVQVPVPDDLRAGKRVLD